MTDFFLPLPEVRPLNRLHIYDSLIINAERWLRTQKYHRDRQNLHYQSINQPGIVCGLGVRVIEPPPESPARFRDRRWVEIQPGIAIDLEGNPIIVTEDVDRKFHIASETPQSGTLTVYLVISYVEPDNPQYPQDSDEVREWFRFEEKTTPPDERELELCRIQLKPGEVRLERPSNPLQPGINQLDLRHRLWAQARPKAVVRVAQLEGELSNQEYYYHNLLALSQAIAALYPPLQIVVEPHAIRQMMGVALPYDVLYFNSPQLDQMSEPSIEGLKMYVKTGGVLLIEVSSDSNAAELVKQQLEQRLDISLMSWQETYQAAMTPAVECLKLLQTQPFLFVVPPTLQQHPIQLWSGDGIVLIAGQLSSAWGFHPQLALPRHEIRAAQEFGINLLYFAWRRRYLTQLSS
jgi:hypothetical protein